MEPTFERARALYGSDEQMARDLFEQLIRVRIDFELQRHLRRRAEARLKACLANTKTDGEMKK
jgi:hypothetical protein